MKTGNTRKIVTPENEFLKQNPELFNMYLKMPARFKEEWLLFKKKCNNLGLEFEDVLGDLLTQFNKGGISYKGK